MLINPTLAKQQARRVCVVGVPLWRFVLARGTQWQAAVAQATAEGGSSSSSSNSSTASRVSLSPAAIKKARAEFAAQDPSHKKFLELRENRNLNQHIGTLLKLLSVTDDPLTIEADIVTSRSVLLLLKWGPAGSCWPLLSTSGSCWVTVGHAGSCKVFPTKA